MRYDQIIINHVPTSSPKRTGRAMTPQYITVHNTGNPHSTAVNERAYLTNPSNTTTTGYHIVVDAAQAIECLPLNEVAYHAGDGRYGPGNSQSIGIEICESGDYASNETAAVELIADLLNRYGWSIDRVQPHKHWSGKYCPRLTLPRWKAFISQIQAQMDIQRQEGYAVERLTIIKDGQAVEVSAVNIDGNNYVKLQDLPKLADVIIGYNGQPTVTTCSKEDRV